MPGSLLTQRTLGPLPPSDACSHSRENAAYRPSHSLEPNSRVQPPTKEIMAIDELELRQAHSAVNISWPVMRTAVWQGTDTSLCPRGQKRARSGW